MNPYDGVANNLFVCWHRSVDLVRAVCYTTVHEANAKRSGDSNIASRDLRASTEDQRLGRRTSHRSRRGRSLRGVVVVAWHVDAGVRQGRGLSDSSRPRGALAEPALRHQGSSWSRSRSSRAGLLRGRDDRSRRGTRQCARRGPRTAPATGLRPRTRSCAACSTRRAPASCELIRRARRSALAAKKARRAQLGPCATATPRTPSGGPWSAPSSKPCSFVAAPPRRAGILLSARDRRRVGSAGSGCTGSLRGPRCRTSSWRDRSHHRPGCGSIGQ